MNREDFWTDYLTKRGVIGPKLAEPVIDEFGDNPKLANELVGLIMEGKKTASCALMYEYKKENEELPVSGQVKLVVDGSYNPVCVIETTEVQVKPYREVDQGFAYDEGEDDRSYESWDREHRKYFRRFLGQEGIEFDDKMLLVLERFRLVYKGDHKPTC